MSWLSEPPQIFFLIIIVEQVEDILMKHFDCQAALGRYELTKLRQPLMPLAMPVSQRPTLSASRRPLRTLHTRQCPRDRRSVAPQNRGNVPDAPIKSVATIESVIYLRGLRLVFLPQLPPLPPCLIVRDIADQKDIQRVPSLLKLPKLRPQLCLLSLRNVPCPVNCARLLPTVFANITIMRGFLRRRAREVR